MRAPAQRVEVSCKKCGKKYTKLKGDLTRWDGKCKKCCNDQFRGFFIGKVSPADVGSAGVGGG